MTISPSLADHWDAAHRDCSETPSIPMDFDRARFVLGRHAGHGPGCQQYLTALTATSSPTA